MFRSFFPDPRLFFLSALAWTVVAFTVWFSIGEELSKLINIGAGFIAEPGEGGRAPLPDRRKILDLSIYIDVRGELLRHLGVAGAQSVVLVVSGRNNRVSRVDLLQRADRGVFEYLVRKFLRFNPACAHQTQYRHTRGLLRATIHCCVRIGSVHYFPSGLSISSHRTIYSAGAKP